MQRTNQRVSKHMLTKPVLAVPFFLLLLWSGCNKNEMPKQVDTSRVTQQPRIQTTGPIKYVALGDSTGAGIGARDGGYVARIFRRLVVERPGSKLTNLCVSGATTRDLVREQLDRGIAEQPDLVTLGIGINDIGHGLSREQFVQNFETILARLEKETNAVIVVSNLPDISSAPRIPPALRSEYQQQIVDFNQKLEESVARHSVILFDVFSITHEQLALHPEYFSSDGFHPSDQGYELWAEQMWPTVAAAAGIPEK